MDGLNEAGQPNEVRAIYRRRAGKRMGQGAVDQHGQGGEDYRQGGTEGAEYGSHKSSTIDRPNFGA